MNCLASTYFTMVLLVSVSISAKVCILSDALNCKNMVMAMVVMIVLLVGVVAFLLLLLVGVEQ